MYNKCDKNISKKGVLIMDKILKEIIEMYWSDFQKHKNKEYVVSPSIPIIWFGDIETYKKSDLKVVTVALNPSNREFSPSEDKNDKSHKILFRFPKAETIYKNDTLDDNDKEILCEALNSYFETEPYNSWFKWLERALGFLKPSVSYYNGKAQNCAIHIDIYTAVATSPTWGRLSAESKEDLTNIDLFKKLLAYLKPDVVIFSGDFNIFKNTFLNQGSEPLKEYSYTPENAKYPYRIIPFKTDDTVVIFGSNVQGNPLQLKEDFLKTTFSDICERFI